MSLVIEHVTKSFGGVRAIANLSLEVKQGALFGFLGPNGAGKTTTMRMILDIFRPDSGRITWKGVNVSDVLRRNWGYLPEERGLYPKMEVGEQLMYLARLSGISLHDASIRLTTWLERFQIDAYRNKRVEELSKGNQQKVQFLAAILHDPTVLILDEPFGSLDPVNVNILKTVLLELNQQGKTIIFSTHQLEQVEELCNDIVIINKGKSILQGNVREIKHQYGRSIAHLKLDNDSQATWLDELPGVVVKNRRQDYIEMQVETGRDPNRIVKAALQHGGVINRFDVVEPSLTDIFLELVGTSQPPTTIQTTMLHRPVKVTESKPTLKVPSDQARRIIDLALQALKKHDNPRARALAELAFLLVPETEEPLLILASISTPLESMKYLEKALQINPESRRARQGMEWARRRIHQNNNHSLEHDNGQ